jgi:hypothetical protein
MTNAIASPIIPKVLRNPKNSCVNDFELLLLIKTYLLEPNICRLREVNKHSYV